MSLKTISFPVFALFAIFLGIFWIRPSVEAILSGRNTLIQKESLLAEKKKVKEGNVPVLLAERERLISVDNPDKIGTTIYEYLPESESQEKLVDAFQYLASQTGVMISDIIFRDGERRIDEFPASGMMIDGSEEAAASLEIPMPQYDSFVLTAEFRGSYGNIRDFLTAVTRPDRSSELLSFSIERDPETKKGPDGEPLPDSGMLSGLISAKISYLPKRVYRQGYLLPVFEAETFDTQVVDKVKEARNNLPELVFSGNPEQRSNPFSL
jgi:hypothetical protein